MCSLVLIIFKTYIARPLPAVGFTCHSAEVEWAVFSFVSGEPDFGQGFQGVHKKRGLLPGEGDVPRLHPLHERAGTLREGLPQPQTHIGETTCMIIPYPHAEVSVAID